MIGDQHAIARLELVVGWLFLIGTAALLGSAFGRVGEAREQSREDRRALYAELEQRDSRIGELERALERRRRFVGPPEGPPEVTPE